MRAVASALAPAWMLAGAVLAVALMWLVYDAPPKGALVWFVFCLGAWWRDWATRSDA